MLHITVGLLGLILYVLLDFLQKKKTHHTLQGNFPFSIYILLKKQSKISLKKFFKWTKNLGNLTKEVQIVNKCMKRCSTLFVIREMQMKTTRYHRTLSEWPNPAPWPQQAQVGGARGTGGTQTLPAGMRSSV